MLDHLLDAVEITSNPAGLFTPVDKLLPAEIVDAQKGAADWLAELGAADSNAVVNKAQARERQKDIQAAFTGMVTGEDPKTQRSKLLKLNVPVAVQQLVGMLTAYDWEFVEQAKELRGFAVAKILEDCEHPEARHRLRALELLGKITEVGLFTEQVRVTKIDLTDEALEAKIKQKLDKFRNVIDVTDVIDQVADPVDASN